jgi:hypothetical protein
MKLRFRANTLRLRVNQREVDTLAKGTALQERIAFPGDGDFAYVLETSMAPNWQASFHQGVIRVAAPSMEVKNWAADEASLGIYFDLPANGSVLKIAIEKDLECVDGPEEERDPDAFPRTALKAC